MSVSLSVHTNGLDELEDAIAQYLFAFIRLSDGIAANATGLAWLSWKCETAFYELLRGRRVTITMSDGMNLTLKLEG